MLKTDETANKSGGTGLGCLDFRITPPVLLPLLVLGTSLLRNSLHMFTDPDSQLARRAVSLL
jgi:hypothetical protein